MYTDLADMMIKVRKSSGNDPSVIIMLCTSSDCKGLPTSGLAIGKDGAIITCQHTMERCKGSHDRFLKIATELIKAVTFSGNYC